MHIGMEAIHGRLHDALEGKTGRRPCAISAVRTDAERHALQIAALQGLSWAAPDSACPLCELDAVLSLTPAIGTPLAFALVALAVAAPLPSATLSLRRALLLASNRGPPAFA